MERKFRKEVIHLYIWLIHFTVETNTTRWSNYIPIKIKKGKRFEKHVPRPSINCSPYKQKIGKKEKEIFKQRVVSSLWGGGMAWHWVLLLPPRDLGLPRWLGGKESSCQCRRHRSCEFSPWVRNIVWRRKWQPTVVFLPGESHGQRSLAGYSPRGCKELDRGFN